MFLRYSLQVQNGNMERQDGSRIGGVILALGLILGQFLAIIFAYALLDVGSPMQSSSMILWPLGIIVSSVGVLALQVRRTTRLSLILTQLVAWPVLVTVLVHNFSGNGLGGLP